MWRRGSERKQLLEGGLAPKVGEVDCNSHQHHADLADKMQGPAATVQAAGARQAALAAAEAGAETVEGHQDQCMRICLR